MLACPNISSWGILVGMTGLTENCSSWCHCSITYLLGGHRPVLTIQIHLRVYSRDQRPQTGSNEKIPDGLGKGREAQRWEKILGVVLFNPLHFHSSERESHQPTATQQLCGWAWGWDADLFTLTVCLDLEICLCCNPRMQSKFWEYDNSPSN